MGTIIRIHGANFANIAVGKTIPVVGKIAITVDVNYEGYGTVTGGGNYTEGTKITISATPNDGYAFVKWDDDNTDATRTITVSSSKTTYIATFEIEDDVTAFSRVMSKAIRLYNIGMTFNTNLPHAIKQATGANVNNRATIACLKDDLKQSEIYSTFGSGSNLNGVEDYSIDDIAFIPVKPGVKEIVFPVTTLTGKTPQVYVGGVYNNAALTSSGWKTLTSNTYSYILPEDREGLAYILIMFGSGTSFTKEEFDALELTPYAVPYDD